MAEAPAKDLDPPDAPAPEVSVIVVSYNTAELTLACLDSVYRETPELSFELIVWDNASPDGSADEIARRFPRARLVASPDNLGFARANNEAVGLARGKWVLLLNPDTVVLDRALEKLHAFAVARLASGEEPVAGGRTFFEDGALNPWSVWRAPSLWSVAMAALGFASLFPKAEWANPEAYGGWDRSTVREVGFVSGCLLILRRGLWDRLGGFSPDFFMYAEDADLGIRARRAGATNLICPEARIVHYGGRSEKVAAAAMLRLFRAKSQLMRKHWTRPGAWLGRRLLDLWVLRRLATLTAAALFKPSARQSRRDWLEVARRHDEWWKA